MKPYSRRPALTLIELIVVLAIVAILLTITVPAVQRIRGAAQATECRNNLRQVTLALYSYHNDHGRLPTGCSYQAGKDPQPHMSWMTRLLPYVEQTMLWEEARRAFEVQKFFVKPPHLEILARVIPTYTCPSDGRTLQPAIIGTLQVALTPYLGVSGQNQEIRDGIFYVDSQVRLADIADGTSNTLAIGERPPSSRLNFGWWYAGWGQSKDGSADSVLGVRELRKTTYESYATCPLGPYQFTAGVHSPCDSFHFWSMHPGGAHFAFCDGSVRFLSYAANPLLPAISTRDGREPSEL